MDRKHRWRQDGPDFHTGRNLGTGGAVIWMRNVWRAYAWVSEKEVEEGRGFERTYTTKLKTDKAFEKCRQRAMRAVERWLDRHAPATYCALDNIGTLEQR